MRNSLRKTLAGLCMLCMLVACMPLAALASPAENGPETSLLLETAGEPDTSIELDTDEEEETISGEETESSEEQEENAVPDTEEPEDSPSLLDELGPPVVEEEMPEEDEFGIQAAAFSGFPALYGPSVEAYAEAGGSKNSVMSLLASVPVKTIPSWDQTYTRKMAIQFELDEEALAADDWDTATLRLVSTAFGTTYKSKPKVDVHLVNNDWNAATLTWNNFPATIETVSYFDLDNYFMSPVEGARIYVDVTPAAAYAKEQGWTSVSLVLETAVEDRDNNTGVYIATSRNETFDAPLLALSQGEYRTPGDEWPDESTYKDLREKWYEFYVGITETDDQSSQTVIDHVAKVDNASLGHWDSMAKGDKTGRVNLWSDLEFHKSSGLLSPARSGNMNAHFDRIRAIAVAYRTPGAQLYNNTEVRDEILDALDYMYQNHYNEDMGKNGNSLAEGNVYGNWYHWEISASQNLMYTMLLMYDEMPEALFDNLIAAHQHFNPNADKSSGIVCNGDGQGGANSPTPTMANKLLKGVGVAVEGILTENADKLDNVKAGAQESFKYTSSGDGLYRDGSFIQHNSLAYTTGYGSSYFGSISPIMYVLADTVWELKYPKGDEKILFNYVFDGVEPLLHYTQAMDMTRGRSIAATGSYDRTTGVSLIESLVPIVEAMPDSQRARGRSMIKALVQKDEEYYFTRTSKVYIQNIVRGYLADESLPARTNYEVTKVYGGMARVVHVQTGYSFGIAMSSNAQAKYETYSSGTGRRIWNIADGMTYLYNDDLEQYSNAYWATVDPRRLPGTTTEYKDRGSNSMTTQGEWGKTPYSWAGGSTLGQYGSAGLQLQTFGSARNTVNGSTSKKSWFLFDEEIVALGTDINSGSGDTDSKIQTTVDNRRIALNQANKVYIDGVLVNDAITDNSPAVTVTGSGVNDVTYHEKHGVEYQNARWANIEGNVPGSDIGYYFPAADTILNALVERRDTNWNLQGPDDAEASGSYATLWFDHGAAASGEEYQYVILPGKNAEQTAAYAQSPNIEVLQNDAMAQAARSNKLGVTGINFWAAGETAGVEANGAASVTMQVQGRKAALAIAEPNLKTSGQLQVAFKELNVTSVLSQDSSITVLQTQPHLVVSVDLAVADSISYRGQSQLIEVEIEIDTTALQTLVDSTGTLVEGDYTPNSWDTLQQALAAARTAIDEAAGNDTVNAAYDRLQNAIDKLIARADFTDLAILVAEVKSLAPALYTAESWQALTTALNQAEAVLADLNTEQAAVNTAYSKLFAAKESLVKQPATSVDKTALQALYNANKARDKAAYTSDSWEAFRAAMDAAEKILANANATQQGVDDAKTALQDAINKLRQKEAVEYGLLDVSSHTFTGKEDIVIRVDAPLAEFQGVRVAGTALTKGNQFTVAEGSTVVTLPQAYLTTLPNGTYFVDIRFENGYASLEITVQKTGGSGSGSGGSSGSANVATGDEAATWPASLALVALLATTALLYKKKKAVK